MTDLRRRAEFIEKVLRYSLLSEELTPEIEAARDSIGRCYSELKSHHDFTTSAQMARVEWLMRYLGEP